MKRKIYQLLLLSSFFLISGTPVFAQDTPVDSQESSESSQDESAILPLASDEWEFHLAPLYIWFAGIGGSSSIGPVTAPLDVSFSDVMDNLDTVFTFHFEAQRGKFGLFADYMLLEISAQESAQFGTTPRGTPVGATVDTDMRNDIVEFGGSYRVWEASPSVELLAGVRYTNLELSVVPEAFGLPIPLPSVNVEQSWWDGFGGVRLIQELGENSGWSLIGKADVGGGGSNLTWSALVGVDWQYKDWGSVRAGYKWLGYDYESGTGPDRFALDVVYQGPIAGFKFNW